MSPLRTVVQHVIVVDSHLQPSIKIREGPDTGNVSKHRMCRLPELAVGLEAVLNLVGRKFIQTPHWHLCCSIKRKRNSTAIVCLYKKCYGRDLVSQSGSVLRRQPHVLRDVHATVLPQHNSVSPVLPGHTVWLQTSQTDLSTQSRSSNVNVFF